LPGEMLAIDPRLPRTSQRFHFTLDSAGRTIRRVVWQVDGNPLPSAGDGSATWLLVPGRHRASARAWVDRQDKAVELGPVEFEVMGPDTPRP